MQLLIFMLCESMTSIGALNALVLQELFFKLQPANGSDSATGLLPLDRRLAEDHGATEILSSIHSTTQTNFMNLTC